MRNMGQFVDDEKNRLVVRGAFADESFTVTPPGSGVQPGADLHAEVLCADRRTDLLDVLFDQAPHRGDEARRE